MGNAVTDGYATVTGIGATMVISVAVQAISRKILSTCGGHCPSHIDVFTQLPRYPLYSYMMDHVPNVQWNDSADPLSPWTIEIVTYVYCLI